MVDRDATLQKALALVCYPAAQRIARRHYRNTGEVLLIGKMGLADVWDQAIWKRGDALRAANGLAKSIAELNTLPDGVWRSIELRTLAQMGWPQLEIGGSEGIIKEVLLSALDAERECIEAQVQTKEGGKHAEATAKQSIATWLLECWLLASDEPLPKGPEKRTETDHDWFCATALALDALGSPKGWKEACERALECAKDNGSARIRRLRKIRNELKSMT